MLSDASGVPRLGVATAMTPLADWLAAHGSTALFGLLVVGIAGVPVPDETLLVAAGVLIGRGRLYPVPTYLAAFFGSAVGTTISYVLGAAAGSVVIERYGHRLHLDTANVDHARAAIRRSGRWAVMLGYFVPGVRHFTALVAGAAGLEFGTFAAYAYTGAAVWSAGFITLGWYVGDRWKSVVRQVETHRWVAAVLVLAALVTIWTIRRWRRPLA